MILNQQLQILNGGLEISLRKSGIRPLAGFVGSLGAQRKSAA
jgi:hypothetical protein